MQEFIFNDWQVCSAPECGGNLSCVRWRGHDIMRGFSDISDWQATPTNYGFAVLFPPNRIDGGTFKFNGKEYKLPVNEPARGNHLHGIALREKWQSGECTANSLSMFWEFNDSSDMYADYPFDCLLSVKYTFSESFMEQEFKVKNKSDKIMPCALGFHSAFAVPKQVIVNGTGGRFELLPPRYLMTNREIGWTEGFAPNEWLDPSEIWPFGHMRMDESRSAVLDYGDFKLEYTVDEKFDHWMVWRPEHDTTFLCVEPMNIRIGCFENTPELLPVLAPAEEIKFVSRIKIIHS